MALLAGSANFTEFEVNGDLPETNQLAFIAERIEAYSFKDIDDTFDEYSIGWVSVLDMFNTAQDHLNGDYITMSLRIDERKVSGKVLKKYFEKECRRVRDEQQIPKLSRSMKITIKERIKTEFMRKAKPEPMVADISWDLSGNRLLFFSTNKKAQALLEDFFKETFGLVLRQSVPYTVAEAELPAINGLDSLTATIFV